MKKRAKKRRKGVKAGPEVVTLFRNRTFVDRKREASCSGCRKSNLLKEKEVYIEDQEIS